eukprot:11262490-Karenia_brevis.AAC.1
MMLPPRSSTSPGVSSSTSIGPSGESVGTMASVGSAIRLGEVDLWDGTSATVVGEGGLSIVGVAVGLDVISGSGEAARAAFWSPSPTSASASAGDVGDG